jgi:hypothetical protein
MLPVGWSIKLMGSHCLDINYMHRLRYLGDEHHWSDTTILFTQGLWKDDEIISTDWGELNIECIFKVVSTILLIMRYQLLGMLLLADDVLFNKVGKPLRMRPMIKVEVKTLSKVFLLDVDDLLSSVMLDDHLFQE